MNSEGVRRTARDAMMCKISMASSTAAPQALQSADQTPRDPFAGVQQVQVKRQMPTLDNFYSLRSALMHTLLGIGLATCRSVSCQGSSIGGRSKSTVTIQMLSLGCGLDESYYSFLHFFDNKPSDNDSNHYLVDIFEIDFPEIIAEKSKSSTYKDILDSAKTGAQIGRVVRIAADLTYPDILIAKLEAAGFQFNTPTIAFLEVVSCYIRTNDVANLFNGLRLSIKNLFIIDFEPMFNTSSSTSKESISSFNQSIKFKCGYTEFMSLKFRERGAPLSHTFNTNREHVHFMSHNCGFTHNLSLNFYEMYKLLLVSASSRHEDRPRTQGLYLVNQHVKLVLNPSAFDEFSSLSLLLIKYCINLSISSYSWFEAIHQNIFKSNGDEIDNRTKDGIDNSHQLVGLVLSNSDNSIIKSTSESIEDEAAVGIRISSLIRRIEALEDRFRILMCNDHMKKTVSCGEIAIREVDLSNKDDLNALSRLYEEGFSEVASRYKSVAKFVKQALKNFSKKAPSNATFFFALDGSSPSHDPIGCIGLKHNTAPLNSLMRWEIANFSVSLSHQGRGTGSALLTHVLNKCRAAANAVDAYSVQLELSVVRDLKSAIRLYRKFGFDYVDEIQLEDGCVIEHYSLEVAR